MVIAMKKTKAFLAVFWVFVLLVAMASCTMSMRRSVARLGEPRPVSSNEVPARFVAVALEQAGAPIALLLKEPVMREAGWPPSEPGEFRALLLAKGVVLVDGKPAPDQVSSFELETKDIPRINRELRAMLEGTPRLVRVSMPRTSGEKPVVRTELFDDDYTYVSEYTVSDACIIPVACGESSRMHLEPAFVRGVLVFVMVVFVGSCVFAAIAFIGRLARK